jgi:hypothetical protein
LRASRGAAMNYTSPFTDNIGLGGRRRRDPLRPPPLWHGPAFCVITAGLSEESLR